MSQRQSLDVHECPSHATAVKISFDCYFKTALQSHPHPFPAPPPVTLKETVPARWWRGGGPTSSHAPSEAASCQRSDGREALKGVRGGRMNECNCRCTI